MRVNAIFQEVPEGYIAFIEEIPGVNTQGRTLKEAERNLKEATKLVLDTNRTIAEESLLAGKGKYIRDTWAL